VRLNRISDGLGNSLKAPVNLMLTQSPYLSGTILDPDDDYSTDIIEKCDDGSEQPIERRKLLLKLKLSALALRIADYRCHNGIGE
jgi:hypothetical protein